MAKLSWKTKENIKTSLVLIIVALLIATYAIYPLNNSDTLFSRADTDIILIDSLTPNNPGLFDSTGFAIDTFRFEPDAFTSLASLHIVDSLADSIKGTVILIPSTDTNRTAFFTLIGQLAQNSYSCYTYDQRASGLSTGSYHGFGSLEATDLEELLSYLSFRSQIIQPLYIIGENLGGDAAILASHEDARIKKVIAIEPMLTSDNLIETEKVKNEAISFPFYNSVIFWWYKMNSGFAPTYISVDDLRPVATNTLIITNSENEALTKLQEISEESKLMTKKYTNEKLYEIILSYIYSEEPKK